MEITQYASPNFGFPRGNLGRNGNKINAIFFHISGGSFEVTHNWIMKAHAAAAYHYLIDMDGKIYQYVRDEDAAWSQGTVNQPTWPLYRPGVNPNLHALSIARAGANQNTWTPEQMVSSVWLARRLGGKYGIPLKRPHITGHFEVDSVNRWYCPGMPFFNALIEELSKIEEEADMLKDAIVINSFADFPAVEPLAERLNAPIFLRKALGQLRAENIYIAGGGTSGLTGNLVDLSGQNRYETTQKIYDFLKKLV